MYYPEGMKARVSLVQSNEPHRILASTWDSNQELPGPESRTNRNSFVTFPKYGWATKWHNYCINIVTQKSEMAAANGGYFFEKLHTKNNSDFMQDSCIIPTALPIFSWSRNSMKLFSILCCPSRSQKSKMAVFKEEILISQHVYNIAAKFQQQNSCFQGYGIQ